MKKLFDFLDGISERTLLVIIIVCKGVFAVAVAAAFIRLFSSI